MGLTTNEKGLISRMLRFDNVNSELEKKLAATQQLVNSFTAAAAQFDAKLQAIEEWEAASRKVLAQEEAGLRQRETDVVNLERLLTEKSKSFPWLASAVADLVLLKNKEVSDYLRTKRNPAATAAETVRQIGQEKRALAEQLKLAQYTLDQYESLFPFLTQFREDDVEEALLEITEAYAEQPQPQQDDPVKTYLSPGEYAALSPAERNQRALYRYRQARKSSFQIGRDYERYVGYLYESRGYEVSYYGIENGKEDLGRDLICRKGGKTEVVQCKYWSQQKLIHEKHINQLFGTTVMLYLDSANKQKGPQQLHLFPQMLAAGDIAAVFYTSTSLSLTARNFAQALGIHIHEQVAIGPYPMIKCHISTASGEKIYHLPFDQMYDRTKLDKAGEFYAMTVAEAEAKGFRRAWRWRG
ncbi:restriction endonuclease [Hymenobacter sp.]|jgi:hypothetical protein|uniref:restriction endonuclease n=1 Tax=Hymenobacter sp. TaxID=1898978 RepID=UPI002ED8732B